MASDQRAAERVVDLAAVGKLDQVQAAERVLEPARPHLDALPREGCGRR